MTCLKTFLADEAGQSVMEYILLITLIGIVAVFALNLVGIPIGIFIERLTATISQITGH